MIHNLFGLKQTLLDQKDRMAFQMSCFEDNYRRIATLAPVLFLSEIILFFIPERLFSYSTVVLPFIIANVFLIPTVLLIRRSLANHHPLLINTIQTIYALSILLLGVFLSLESMGIVDFVHMYLMALVAVVTFLIFDTLTRSILFVSSAVIFAFYLPRYQPDPDVRFVVLFNVLIFALISWLLGMIMYREKVRIFVNHQALLAKSDELKTISQKDSMTQLFNHEISFEKLGEEIERAQRIGYPLSLIISDIDDFKHVNDQYGHQVGDRVIKQLASTILAQSRSTDIVGRYGGEEFILILPDTRSADAIQLVERIRQAIIESQKAFGFAVTLSGGISEYQGETIDSFIRLTDQKLYHAKNTGKNRFVAQMPTQ